MSKLPGCTAVECATGNRCSYPTACRALALLSDAGRAGVAKIRAHREVVPPPMSAVDRGWERGPVPVATREAMIASAPSRRGRWRQTYLDRPVWPLDPRPGDFAIADIAHGLAGLARYGGATRRRYYVAEHSVLVSLYGNPAYARHKILHDAAEAVTGVDMASPIKRDPALAGWRAIEDAIQRAIYVQFGLDPDDLGDTLEIDRRILLDERNALFGPPPLEWGVPGDPLGAWVRGLTPDGAEMFFLHRLRELFPEHTAEIEAAMGMLL